MKKNLIKLSLAAFLLCFGLTASAEDVVLFNGYLYKYELYNPVNKLLKDTTRSVVYKTDNGSKVSSVITSVYNLGKSTVTNFINIDNANLTNISLKNEGGKNVLYFKYNKSKVSGGEILSLEFNCSDVEMFEIINPGDLVTGYPSAGLSPMKQGEKCSYTASNNKNFNSEVKSVIDFKVTLKNINISNLNFNIITKKNRGQSKSSDHIAVMGEVHQPVSLNMSNLTYSGFDSCVDYSGTSADSEYRRKLFFIKYGYFHLGNYHGMYSNYLNQNNKNYIKSMNHVLYPMFSSLQSFQDQNSLPVSLTYQFDDMTLQKMKNIGCGLDQPVYKQRSFVNIQSNTLDSALNGIGYTEIHPVSLTNNQAVLLANDFIKKEYGSLVNTIKTSVNNGLEDLSAVIFSKEGGSVKISRDKSNSNVFELSAVPNSGYVFANWKNFNRGFNESVISFENPKTFNLVPGYFGANFVKSTSTSPALPNTNTVSTTSATTRVTTTRATTTVNNTNTSQTYTLTTSMSGDGKGVLSVTGKKTIYKPGEKATLAARASSGSTFVGWTGACSGSDRVCFVQMDSDKSAEAVFSLNKPKTTNTTNTTNTANTTTVSTNTSTVTSNNTINTSGDTVIDTTNTNVTITTVGPGTVTQKRSSSGSGLSAKRINTLTATPNPDAVFVAWTGDCAKIKTNVCRLTNPIKANVGAVFSLKNATSTGTPISSMIMSVEYRDLSVGTTDPGVITLQQYLNSNGYIVNSVAGAAGSVGYETDYFGEKTRRALIKLQKDNNIYPANGYFGPKTRNVIGL